MSYAISPLSYYIDCICNLTIITIYYHHIVRNYVCSFFAIRSSSHKQLETATFWKNLWWTFGYCWWSSWRIDNCCDSSHPARKTQADSFTGHQRQAPEALVGAKSPYADVDGLSFGWGKKDTLLKNVVENQLQAITVQHCF